MVQGSGLEKKKREKPLFFSSYFKVDASLNEPHKLLSVDVPMASIDLSITASFTMMKVVLQYLLVTSAFTNSQNK